MRTPFRTRRRGLVLIETTVTLAVLLAAIAIGLTTFRQALLQRRVAEQRAAAREVVALTLERLRALDSSALPAPGVAAPLPLPPFLAASLPSARCELTVEPVKDQERLRRLRVTVRWGRAGPAGGGQEMESAEAIRGDSP